MKPRRETFAASMTIAAGLTVAMLGFGREAHAQAPLTLTIDDAVRRGVEHSPKLAEARERQHAAETNITALRALAYPAATASMQYLRMNHTDEFRIPDGTGGTRVFYPDIPNAYKAHVEFTVPVYSFGRVSTNLAAAGSEVDATRAEGRAAESDVRLDVMRAYWNLATARETVRVLERSLERTDAAVSDVKAKFDAGFLAPNDVLSAQAQRARQQVRLLQARNDASLAELDLGRLIGVPPGTPIQTTSAVDQPLSQVSVLSRLSASELVERAAGQRAERAGLTARSDGLRHAAEAALANLKPYAIAGAAVDPQRPNSRFIPPADTWRTSWTLDVKFVWPFFDGGRSKAQAAGLTAQANAVQARRDDFDGLVALEIRQRLLDLQFGAAAIAATDEAIAAATEARRVVDERFRAGVATSTEVLDAQIALLEAELDKARLQAGLRLSEARLLRAVGEK